MVVPPPHHPPPVADVNRRQLLASALLIPLTKGTPPMRMPYQNSASCVLDGTGAGSVTFNGPASLTVRELSNVVVLCDTATPRPTARIYRSVIAPNRLMGSTPIGNDDTMVADSGDVLQSGEPLIVVWSGGAPGAQCYANVNGWDDRA